MPRPKLIRTSKFILVAFKGIYLVSFLIFFGVVVSWYVDQSLWLNVDITSGFKAGFGIEKIHFSPENMPKNAIMLSNISSSMMGWLVLRNTIFFCLGWVVILQVGKILKSIESIDVFYVSNIESFKTIGKLCFAIAAFSAFNFYSDSGETNIDFTIPFLPILFGFASYVLAEVFKQGQELTEDKNSII